MRGILFILISGLLANCSPKNKELFELTDTFVESLQTSYESYGMLGGTEHKRITSDGRYQVVPIGRLINVKIMVPVDNDVYSELEEDLESHYKDDKRVNDVYINNAGTIMIDCRN